MDCLSLKKTVIAVPRLREFGEAQDDGLGQSELVNELEKEGAILAIKDLSKLEEAISKANTFEAKPLAPSNIPDLVADFVESCRKEF